MDPVTGTIVGAACAAGALAAAPVVLSAAGFTGAGVAAGSVGAKFMSVAALANGGGVVAGSTVAVLQSVGAAGVSATTSAAVAGAGALMGWWSSEGGN